MKKLLTIATLCGCILCWGNHEALATGNNINNQNQGSVHHNTVNNNTTNVNVENDVTNNTNRNVNTNTNRNVNNNTSNSNSNSVSGAVAIGGTSNNSNTVNGGTQSQSATASGGTGGSVGNVSNSFVNKEAASSANAPALTSSNDTCMGSSSGGAQGTGFGISLGSTWTDEDCVRRKDARFLHNIGLNDTALALMCEKKSVRMAILKTGTEAQKEICGVNGKTVEEVKTEVTRNKPPSGNDFSNLRD